MMGISCCWRCIVLYRVIGSVLPFPVIIVVEVKLGAKVAGQLALKGTAWSVSPSIPSE